MCSTEGRVLLTERSRSNPATAATETSREKLSVCRLCCLIERTKLSRDCKAAPRFANDPSSEPDPTGLECVEDEFGVLRSSLLTVLDFRRHESITKSTDAS